MKCINPKTLTFATLFSEQDIKNKNFILAPYCIDIPCNEGTLLYNGLSRELVLLANDEPDLLQNINSVSDEVSDYLKKGWFFIPDDKSGKKYCDQMLDTARLI